MRILMLLAMMALLPVSSAVAAPEDRPFDLTYQFTVTTSSSGARALVEVRMKGNASGTTQLTLPSEWGGQEHLYDCIKDLTVLSPGAQLARGADPALATITHKPGQELKIRYEIVQDVAGVPSAGRHTSYRPFLQPTFVHWIGHAALVTPHIDDDAKVDVTMSWKGLPDSWVVATSFGASGRSQHFRGDLGAFTNSIFVAGDFRVHTADVHGRKVVVAMRGSWKFSDEQFAALVSSIFRVEREFWSDFDYPYYLVTLIPLDARPGETSIGGTGLTDSFGTFVTANTELDGLKWLLAHELFHNWNPYGLGKVREPEGRMFWFSEGFTDYYAYELLRRSGLATEKQYVDHYNELLRSYYMSPVRDASNERIEKEFFANDDVGLLPYWRGALIAMRWDSQIRAASKGARSLDDLMRALRERSRATRGAELSNEAIAAVAREFLGADPLPDLTRFVVNGELIAPDPGGAGAGYDVEVIEVARFELGADLDTIVQKKMIAGVVPDSAAFAAGLRDGQTIARRLPIHVGDPNHPVEITVREGDAEKTITYLPRSRATVRVPQFRKKELAAGVN